MAAGADGEVGGGGLVECTLPPAVEVADGVAQAVGFQTGGSEVEYRYLCAGGAVEGAIAGYGYKYAEVGVGPRFDAELEVVDEQAEVAQCMIFTQSGGGKDGDAPDAFRCEISYGFGLIVGLLIREVADDVAISGGDQRRE